MKRREFIKGGSVAAITALGGFGAAIAADADETLPAWRPGELELHFIYTGCGENMFYRLPDGTAILNDTGDAYRPKDVTYTPLLPSPDRLGGDWVSRYIQRVYPEKVIDYLIFSHWHSDHIGHSGFGLKSTVMKYKTPLTAKKKNIDDHPHAATHGRNQEASPHATSWFMKSAIAMPLARMRSGMSSERTSHTQSPGPSE